MNYVPEPTKVDADLEKRFTYHAPKEGQPRIYEELWDNAKGFAYMDGWHTGYRARMQDEAAWREKLIADEQRMKRRKRK